MAIASYTTDLTTIAIGDIGIDAGTWGESSDGGWDTGGAMVDDGNLYYNGVACVSAQLTKDSNGTGAAGPATIMYLHTAAFTIPADGAALIHHLWAAPPALNTLANSGIIILAGTDLGNFYGWNASGSDFAPAPRGGWANYAINPAIASPDFTVGTITTYNMIGMAVAATAQARGNPNACNAVRYGRCEAIFTDGDFANGYATFNGYALVDSASANKWNLIDPVAGGYQIQGLMSLGTAGTPVDFRDENKSLSIINTINVTTAFNKIEVNNAASNIEWSAISISALGTVSIGSFEMVDNATVLKTSCTFTDMGTFIYLSNATILNSIYRRCGIITTVSASFTGCTFDNAIGSTAVLCTDLIDISSCTFNSSGTGHAMEIAPTGAGPHTINLSGNQFTGYAATDGSTGNEAILINPATSSADITLNIVGGGSIPTIMLDAGYTGAFTLVVQPVTLKVIVKDTLGAIIENARVIVLVSDSLNFPFNETVTATSSGTIATITHPAHGYVSNDYVRINGANENDYNGAFQITVVDVNTYTYTMTGATASPATGTLKSTTVLLIGLTDALGVIENTKSYGVNQNISGRVRKSTGSPYYKTSGISGVIDKASGATINVQMIGD